MEQYPINTSAGCTWYLYQPEFDWPQEEMDVEKEIFDKLQGGTYEHFDNGVICRSYPTVGEALDALTAAYNPVSE